MTVSQMVGLGLFLGAAVFYVVMYQTRWRAISGDNRENGEK